jgi:hypothetical protein
MKSLTLRVLTAVSLAAAVVSFAPDAGSAQDCARANGELRAAQSALADAMRRADEAGASYHACMQGSRHDARACVAQKRALDTAMQHKRQARSNYDAAVENKRRSCR